MPDLQSSHIDEPEVAAIVPPVLGRKFIRNTYIHLFIAMLAFVGIEFVLSQIPLSYHLSGLMLSTNFSWLIVLGAFI